MSPYNPDIHNRKSIRLKNYDYSQKGFYFVTMVIQNRLYLLSEVKNKKVFFKESGKMVLNIWNEIPIFYPNFEIHDFIVMPNHIHGIIEIKEQTNLKLSDLIQRFKNLTTKKYIENVHNSDWQPFEKKLWQRNYFEHIIRDEKALLNIKNYIQNNPINWENDEYFL
jgi:REP element-mobilizing transposase RayT